MLAVTCAFFKDAVPVTESVRRTLVVATSIKFGCCCVSTAGVLLLKIASSCSDVFEGFFRVLALLVVGVEGVNGSKVSSVTDKSTLPTRMISGIPFCEVAAIVKDR